jgi:hypothetical protein
MLDRDTLGGRVDVNEGRRLSLMKGETMTVHRMDIYPTNTRGMVYVVAGNVTAVTTVEDAKSWGYRFLAECQDAQFVEWHNGADKQ